jgi:hypothetical protein
MSFLPADIDKYNEDIKAWNDGTYREVKAEMDRLGIKHLPGSRSPISLQRAITTRLRKQDELVNRIGYQFPRHGVFVHKGVSRGHGKGNPRTAKEFLQPVIDRRFDELENIVLDGTGSMIINALAIK